MSVVFEVTGVTALQDVNFGVVDFWVYVVIHSPVFGAQVFGTGWALEPRHLGHVSETYKVGARFALNSQWKMRTVFPQASPLIDGLGLSILAPRRNSSTAAVVLMLRALGTCPPLYS